MPLSLRWPAAACLVSAAVMALPTSTTPSPNSTLAGSVVPDEDGGETGEMNKSVIIVGVLSAVAGVSLLVGLVHICRLGRTSHNEPSVASEKGGATPTTTPSLAVAGAAAEGCRPAARSGGGRFSSSFRRSTRRSSCVVGILNSTGSKRSSRSSLAAGRRPRVSFTEGTKPATTSPGRQKEVKNEIEPQEVHSAERVAGENCIGELGYI